MDSLEERGEFEDSGSQGVVVVCLSPHVAFDCAFGQSSLDDSAHCFDVFGDFGVSAPGVCDDDAWLGIWFIVTEAIQFLQGLVIVSHVYLLEIVCAMAYPDKATRVAGIHQVFLTCVCSVAGAVIVIVSEPLGAVGRVVLFVDGV